MQQHSPSIDDSRVYAGLEDDESVIQAMFDVDVNEYQGYVLGLFRRIEKTSLRMRVKFSVTGGTVHVRLIVKGNRDRVREFMRIL